jgi:hypothetical protein
MSFIKKNLKQLGSAMAYNPRKRPHQLDVEVENATFFLKNGHGKFRGLRGGFESLSFDS